MSRLSPAYSHDTAFTLRAGKQHQVVWFADYADDATRRVRDVLLRSIDRFEGMDIAFAVRFFPNGSQEKGGEIAARAAIAAAQRGRFADMHQALFAAGHTYSRASIIELAQQLGLDPDRLAARGEYRGNSAQAAIKRPELTPGQSPGHDGPGRPGNLSLQYRDDERYDRGMRYTISSGSTPHQSISGRRSWHPVLKTGICPMFHCAIHESSLPKRACETAMLNRQTARQETMY